jgi:hypothetical protein
MYILFFDCGATRDPVASSYYVHVAELFYGEADWKCINMYIT